MRRRSNRIGEWVARQRGRITAAGWILLGSAAFAASVGLDTENSVAYQAFALFAAFGMVGGLFALGFRVDLEVERGLPRFGTAGEPLAYWMQLRNRGKKPQRGLEVAEHMGDAAGRIREWLRPLKPDRRARTFGYTKRIRRPMGAVCPFQPLPDLPPLAATSARLEITPLRRGPLLLDGVTIARSDPFGLVRSFVHLQQPQRILILPKRYLIPDTSLPGKELYQQGGVAQASSVGRSEEFVSLRDYRRGDPMRHIHWRSWARVGEPIVKEFEDDCFVRHGLVLDTFDDALDESSFEEAVSVAASYACQLRTQESLLDLMFVGVKAFRFTVGRGLAHSDQLLEILACAELSRDRDFSMLSSLVLDHADGLTGCVLVLLKWDESRKELVRHLLARGLALRVLVIQPAGGALQFSGADAGLGRDGFLELRAGRIEEDLAGLP